MKTCCFQDGISFKVKNEQKDERTVEDEEEVTQEETTIFGLSNIPVVCKTEEVHTEELLVEEVSGKEVAHVLRWTKGSVLMCAHVIPRVGRCERNFKY